MKLKSFAIVACLAMVLTGGTLLQADETWTTVLKDNRMTISVDQALYEKKGPPDFYLRVRITNLTDHPVGIDLRDKRWLIHINQWGPSDEDHRTVVDEMTLEPEKLDVTRRQELLDAFQANKLTLIPARGTFDYYINFGGGGAGPDIKSRSHKYILLSIKGQIFFTDGTVAWDGHADMDVADVALKQPVQWKKIPADAFIITK